MKFNLSMENIYDVTFMRSLENSILCRIFHTGIAKRRQTIYSTNERAHCNFHVNLTTVIVVAPLLFCYYPRTNLDFKGHHYWEKTTLKCFFPLRIDFCYLMENHVIIPL